MIFCNDLNKSAGRQIFFMNVLTGEQRYYIMLSTDNYTLSHTLLPHPNTVAHHKKGEIK